MPNIKRKPAKKPKSSKSSKAGKPAKSAKDKLAAGAAEIRKLSAGKPKKKKVSDIANGSTPPNAIIESERDLSEIIAERLRPSNDVGVELLPGTPIEEFVPILRQISHEAECRGFVMGDLLNQGRKEYGDALFEQAVAMTGRSVATLKDYARVSERMKLEQRSAHSLLTFAHAKELIVLDDVPREKLLKEIIAEADKPGATFPTVKLIRKRIAKIKTPKKARGAKKKKKTATPPYEMSPFESTLFDDFQTKAEDLAKLLRLDDLKFIHGIDETKRKDLLATLQPVRDFGDDLASSLK